MGSRVSTVDLLSDLMSSGLGRDEGRVIGNLYVGKMVERNVTWIIVLVLVVLSIRLARSSRLIRASRASRASRVNLLVNLLVRLVQNPGCFGFVVAIQLRLAQSPWPFRQHR